MVVGWGGRGGLMWFLAGVAVARLGVMVSLYWSKVTEVMPHGMDQRAEAKGGIHFENHAKNRGPYPKVLGT